MSKSYMLVFLLFLITGLSINKNSVFAEENVNRLIMSEIYLDEDEPSKNWIEVYNPTDEPLTLMRLRLSTLLTPNILPPEYKEGIEILPKNRIVLCALDKNIETNAVKVEIIPLSVTLRGGFIGIETKKEKGVINKEENVDVIRFGDSERSSYVKAFSNIQVIPMQKNGKSFSRDISIQNSNNTLPSFIESDPTPGE
ncbi:MAG: hypothetical protein JXB48_06930 [Candidatus Latescibacteria bacterium]|nr:hypothetical protein [Candidatus Latescibacterota bacterium]